MNRLLCPALLVCLMTGCASMKTSLSPDELEKQVLETERAFARTMAERNFAAFGSFISQEAVFFSGKKPLRGKEQVTRWWRRYYEEPSAPFSWEPGQVQVLDSGTLALSTGPVRDASGRLLGTFTSIWRLEAPGTWRIIFDIGNPVCNEEEAAKK